MRIATVNGLTATVLAVLCVGGLAAQDLSLKRDLPPLPSNACEARGYVFAPDPVPSPEAATEAEGLASEANQATILGQYQRARTVLSEAVGLDRTSASVSYSFGRLLEGGGEQEAALSEFCRFLGIDPQEPEITDVEERVERIGIEVGALGVSPARAALEEGIRAFDLGDYDGAVLDFSRALVELPDWNQAHFNRALAYLDSGRAAAGAADLQFYLELAPEAADRAEIESLLNELAPLTEYSPRTAFVRGLFIPGMGHFYSGRPGLGILVLGAAGTSIGFAILHKEIEIGCLSPPVNEECPQGSRDRRGGSAL